MDNYINYLKNKSCTQDTIKSFTAHINEYLKLYSNINYSTSIFTRENIIFYISYLKNKPNKPQTINAKLSALKSYTEFLNTPIIISDDFIKIQKKAISPAKHDSKDITKILTKAKENESKRNFALIYLLPSTAIRRSEAVNIKLSHIDFKKHKLSIIDGKGQKNRDIILNDKVIEYLKDYINTERKESKHANSEYLFISRQSDKLDRGVVNKIIDKYNINPHAFRHYWASESLRNGATLQAIGANLGHSSLNSTSIYTNPTEKEMIKQANSMVINV